jgi:hypothetical protein
VTANANRITEIIFVLEAPKIKGGGADRAEVISFAGFHCLILGFVR